MNKKIIIQIPFNVQGFNENNELNSEWIKYRLKIFINYTLKSLIAQTNQYFTALLKCKDITLPIIKKEIGSGLPENILIVGKNEYQNKIKELIKDYNYFYSVRMDSDDMYVKTFVDMLHNYPPKSETEVLINQNCYVYDIYQKRIAYFWYNSPPSYTLIYRVKDYVEGKRYYLKNGHGGAILLKHELISGINSLDTIHKKNDSSTFHSSNWDKWKEIEEKEEIKNILNDFGITPERGKESENKG